jgi:AraC family transcriptional regulator of adaptative response / DNA-3-methyladenine glycosylase II
MVQDRGMSSAVDVLPQPGLAPAGLDADAAYAALAARDRRFDGRIWFGVTSTGVYCRPVCPAQTPKPQNVRFFAAPAAAVSAGFRACRRCRPDSAPGSRHWDHRGDLVGRALRLIADGAIDDGGVAGLARTLHVSERHLHRSLVAEVGAGPLQLAVSRRAQTAKLLVEQTDLSLSDIAFASGFSSVRQFNDVMRREFGVAPSGLRRAPAERLPSADPMLVLRLRLRPPYDAEAMGAFLAARTVPGLEEHEVRGRRWTHRRTLVLPARTALVEVGIADDHVVVRSDADVQDTAALVRRVRRWLDLDADPHTVGAALSEDPVLAALVARRPGLRVPASVDPWETLVRAVVGQQVSVAGATTLLGRLVAAYGGEGPGGLRTFPSAAVLAEADPASITGMPRSRARTVVEVAQAVASGAVDLADPDLDAVEASLLQVRGIGPWTAEYVRMRGLCDPDVLPAGDLVLRQSAAALGLPDDARALAARALAWSPWRSYAASHLWAVAPVRSTEETA